MPCLPFCPLPALFRLDTAVEAHLYLSERILTAARRAIPARAEKPLMREKPWDRDHVLPWPQIKAVWETYWDTKKPVLLEKSPPNIIRTREILANFKPVKFIVMVRNPYAHSEGLMRRNNMSAKRAANFSIMCLRTQLNNARELDNALVLTYESLVLGPAKVTQKITNFMPQLNDMDCEADFTLDSVEGTLMRPITNLNAQKIDALSAASIASMNDVFCSICKHWLRGDISC